MRIKDKIENISYVNTLDFFESRAKKYSENNPYSVTMYQDEHPDLVKQRNLEEIKKFYGLGYVYREDLSGETEYVFERNL